MSSMCFMVYIKTHKRLFDHEDNEEYVDDEKKNYIFLIIRHVLDVFHGKIKKNEKFFIRNN